MLSLDDEAPEWIEPCKFPGHFRSLNHRASEIVDSLDNFGLLGAYGLRLLHDIWCAVEFGDDSL